RALARAGHAVDVFTRRDRADLAPVVQVEPRLRVVHVPAGAPAFVPKERLLPLMPEFLAGVERVCRAGAGYDVVHANFFMSGWVALQLRRTRGIPFAVTFHALGLVRREHQRGADGFPPQRIEIKREIVDAADMLIAECPQDHWDLQRLYGADPERIVMVPCGFDPREMRPMDRASARRALGLPPDGFVVLQLGRLVPRQGIDNVIRALALLPPRIDARLLVVGGESDTPDETATPESGRLRGVARECGVTDRVVFTGRRQRRELRRFYAASNVFVSTPWYEPFGITPLEAMACAIPVIGSAVGGIQYTVVPGVTGQLVPPKDPAALAARLRELHDAPALAAALGHAGLARVRRSFTWQRMGAEIGVVLESLCPRQAPPRRHAPIGFVRRRGEAREPAGANTRERQPG